MKYTAKDAREFDRAMLAFYKARVAAGSKEPVMETSEEFGEDSAIQIQ